MTQIAHYIDPADTDGKETGLTCSKRGYPLHQMLSQVICLQCIHVSPAWHNGRKWRKTSTDRSASDNQLTSGDGCRPDPKRLLIGIWYFNDFNDNVLFWFQLRLSNISAFWTNIRRSLLLHRMLWMFVDILLQLPYLQRATWHCNRPESWTIFDVHRWS